MTGWADAHIEKLRNGEIVSFRPRGNSMKPLIESGQLVTVAPAIGPIVGDVVLARVRGRVLLHKISAAKDGQFQISNNRGYVNGWCARNAIYGRVIRVEN